MKKLTVLLVDSSLFVETLLDDIEIVRIEKSNLRSAIEQANGKYISFIFNDDVVSENYFDYLYQKCFSEFDCCYINNFVNYNLNKDNKRNNSYDYLKTLKPYYLEYLWQFLFKTDVLKEILTFEFNWEFDSKIDALIKNQEAIEDIIYYHNPIVDYCTLSYFPYVDFKEVKKCKNMIYIGDIHGRFSGLITWITNIGKCFGKDYELTFIYNQIDDEIKELIEPYFEVVRHENFVNYICDRFIDTYLDYDYPRNIFYCEESSTFIHGIMFENYFLSPDLYDKYIAVSKTCRDTVKFGFETNKKVDYIHNPIKMDKKSIKPHLKLVSTTRSQNIKGVERLEKFAQILDEENIPYTWNVFTDANEGINHSGFIYRNAVFNPLSYVNDADYLVMLSDTESFCYSVLESLILNTKVIVSELDVFKELGVKNGENGYFIPFEFFEDNNKEKLREKVLEIYNAKNKKIKYEPVCLNFDRFGELFKK